MGLLSSNRILDTILTDEGRRQLGTGQFQPAFYSFSDAGAVYCSTDTQVSGTSPNSGIASLLAFEAFPLPQDQVSFEADDSGGLKAFANNNYFSASFGFTGSIRVISGKLIRGWETGAPEVLSASAQFASVASNLLSDNTNNIRKLMLLKSPDILYSNQDEFKLSSNEVNFHITSNTTLPGWVTQGNLDASEGLMSDRKLSHIDNFKFLPPINKRPNLNDNSIGNYADIINGNRQILSYNDLKNEFRNIVVTDGTTQTSCPTQRETIKFTETTITNRIIGQMFEIADGRITKLDVIDFGVFLARKSDSPLFPEAIPTPLNPDLVTATTRIHVYFVGKVYQASDKTDRFLNLFSLVWQS